MIIYIYICALDMSDPSAVGHSQPDDLTFQKNDIIIITQKENEHWFRGFVQNDPSARAGLFPSNVRCHHIIHNSNPLDADDATLNPCLR
jgi:hypothetical protein